MTATGLLIVHTTPLEGADEDEFNRWYTEDHAPEMIERGAAVGFQRYRASGMSLTSGAREPGSYVCVYQIEAKSVEDVEAITQRLRDTRHLTKGVSPTLDPGSIQAGFYLPIPGAEGSR